jgi:hypothetical protein
MPIDHTASAVNRAKDILMVLDKHRLETPVQTEELRWLLQTLVDLGMQAPSPLPMSLGRRMERDLADNAHRTVLGSLVAVQEAEKSRGW